MRSTSCRGRKTQAGRVCLTNGKDKADKIFFVQSILYVQIWNIFQARAITIQAQQICMVPEGQSFISVGRPWSALK